VGEFSHKFSIAHGIKLLIGSEKVWGAKIARTSSITMPSLIGIVYLTVMGQHFCTPSATKLKFGKNLEVALMPNFHDSNNPVFKNPTRFYSVFRGIFLFQCAVLDAVHIKN